MKISIGEIVYRVVLEKVQAYGSSISEIELDEALRNRIIPLLRDDNGRAELRELLGQVATTGFAINRLEEALNRPIDVKDWQIGEALAEAYLTDHRDCEFPWPFGRDLRNPKASPAGADLVGFHTHNGIIRFGFGEVKTSKEKNWPPGVVTSRHGLEKQLEDLRDLKRIKDHLVINYLGHRFQNATWKTKYLDAASRYLKNDTDVSLFGFLIRDVEPKEEDLRSRAENIANSCPTDTLVELHAMYLHRGAISTIVDRTSRLIGAE